MLEPILIVGASARAAAGSAVRAGLTPFAVDLFCDEDLQQMARGARRAQHYPADLPALVQEFPPSAWIYTGALENHPHIIQAIAATRELWGTPADATRQVRDPWQLADRLRSRQLLFPQVARDEACGSHVGEPPQRWLRKPYRSAGGNNIQRYAPGKSTTDRSGRSTRLRDPGACYLQQVVEGEAQSAVFVAAGGDAALLGVTQQLVGTAWAGAEGYRYAGSIGPLRLTPARRSQWQQIGACLAEAFDLRGLFGVDAIVNAEGIWTIEVNPRYTSSIEVLEMGFDLQAITAHVDACRERRLPQGVPAQPDRFVGKAVIYATTDLQIDEPLVEAMRAANVGQCWPPIADIPSSGQTISAGQPVATVFSIGPRLEEVATGLQATAETWRARWRC